jgi:hypothetical protein
MKGLTAVLTVAMIAGMATSATAQQSKPPKDSAKSIPADARPPKGMCRIWIDGVPANQQAAPTDCRTAVRNLPPNGRVIFGDDYRDSTKADPKAKLPPVKGFQDVRPPALAPRRPNDG